MAQYHPSPLYWLRPARRSSTRQRSQIAGISAKRVTVRCSVTHDIGTIFQFLLLAIVPLGLQKLSRKTPPGMSKATLATGVGAILFVALLLLLGIYSKDCGRRVLHISARGLWSMAHSHQLAFVRITATMAQMVWNGCGVRPCLGRDRLGWNGCFRVSEHACNTSSAFRECS